MKEEGLVGSYVMEVWPWTSEAGIEVLKGGMARWSDRGVHLLSQPAPALRHQPFLGSHP